MSQNGENTTAELWERLSDLWHAWAERPLENNPNWGAFAQRVVEELSIVITQLRVLSQGTVPIPAPPLAIALMEAMGRTHRQTLDIDALMRRQVVGTSYGALHVNPDHHMEFSTGWWLPYTSPTPVPGSPLPEPYTSPTPVPGSPEPEPYTSPTPVPGSPEPEASGYIWPNPLVEDWPNVYWLACVVPEPQQPKEGEEEEEGEVPEEEVPEEEVPEEDVPEEEVPEDEVPEDQVPEEEVPEEEVPRDEVPQDEVPQDDWMVPEDQEHVHDAEGPAAQAPSTPPNVSRSVTAPPLTHTRTPTPGPRDPWMSPIEEADYRSPSPLPNFPEHRHALPMPRAGRADNVRVLGGPLTDRVVTDYAQGMPLRNEWGRNPTPCRQCASQNRTCRVNFAHGPACNNCVTSKTSCSLVAKKGSIGLWVLKEWLGHPEQHAVHPAEAPAARLSSVVVPEWWTRAFNINNTQRLPHHPSSLTLPSGKRVRARYQGPTSADEAADEEPEQEPDNPSPPPQSRSRSRGKGKGKSKAVAHGQSSREPSPAIQGRRKSARVAAKLHPPSDTPARPIQPAQSSPPSRLGRSRHRAPASPPVASTSHTQPAPRPIRTPRPVPTTFAAPSTPASSAVPPPRILPAVPLTGPVPDPAYAGRNIRADAGFLPSTMLSTDDPLRAVQGASSFPSPSALDDIVDTADIVPLQPLPPAIDPPVRRRISPAPGLPAPSAQTRQMSVPRWEPLQAQVAPAISVPAPRGRRSGGIEVHAEAGPSTRTHRAGPVHAMQITREERSSPPRSDPEAKVPPRLRIKRLRPSQRKRVPRTVPEGPEDNAPPPKRSRVEEPGILRVVPDTREWADMPRVGDLVPPPRLSSVERALDEADPLQSIVAQLRSFEEQPPHGAGQTVPGHAAIDPPQPPQVSGDLQEMFRAFTVELDQLRSTVALQTTNIQELQQVLLDRDIEIQLLDGQLQHLREQLQVAPPNPVVFRSPLSDPLQRHEQHWRQSEPDLPAHGDDGTQGGPDTHENEGSDMDIL